MRGLQKKVVSLHVQHGRAEQDEVPYVEPYVLNPITHHHGGEVGDFLCIFYVDTADYMFTAASSVLIALMLCEFYAKSRTAMELQIGT